MPQKLIVNADDFGLSECVNLGIVEAAKAGAIQSTTLLACGRAFDHAIQLARRVPQLNIGIHLCLDEEVPLLPPEEIPSLVGSDGHFLDRGALLKGLLAFRNVDLGQVRAELDAQIRRCLDAGVSLTHFDGHGHAHVYPGVVDVVVDLAREYGIAACRIPLEPIGFLGREFNFGSYFKKLIVAAFSLYARPKFRAAGISSPEGFYGMMYGGRLSGDRLQSLIREICENRGVSDGGTVEIMSHPGHFDEGELSDYRHWNYDWALELEALQSLSRDSDIASGVEIVSFKELV